VRVRRRGVIVLPKKVRESLGLEEGTPLRVKVEEGKIILEVDDLWERLRRRGRRLRVNLEEAERELDEADEKWLRRVEGL